MVLVLAEEQLERMRFDKEARELKSRNDLFERSLKCYKCLTQ